MLSHAKLKQLHTGEQIGEINVLPQLSGEIDNNIQAFCWAHSHARPCYRRWKQPALGSNLDE